MAAIAPTRQVQGSVELALRGKKRDLYGRFFQATLLLSLLLSLAILIVLLGTAISDAWPVLSARAGTSSRATCRGWTHARVSDKASSDR